MNADLARWPHLKIPTHPVLDWHETEYTATSLLEMAAAVSDTTIPVKGRRDAVWSTAIESVLRSLADNVAALKALNHHRPTPPARVVGLNRAVHVHVLAELHPDQQAKRIWGEVAKAWGCSDRHVKDDVSKHSVQDPGPKDAVRTVPYRPDDAERLVQTIVVNVCNARTRAGKPRSSREDVLEDFDKDMRYRAQQLRASK
jgi:hypothetical protein